MEKKETPVAGCQPLANQSSPGRLRQRLAAAGTSAAACNSSLDHPGRSGRASGEMRKQWGTLEPCVSQPEILSPGSAWILRKSWAEKKSSLWSMALLVKQCLGSAAFPLAPSQVEKYFFSGKSPVFMFMNLVFN